MATTDITYTTQNDEEFTGILAAPDGDHRLPGILLITAIWGIDASARAIAESWADDGFIVSVPGNILREFLYPPIAAHSGSPALRSPSR